MQARRSECPLRRKLIAPRNLPACTCIARPTPPSPHICERERERNQVHIQNPYIHLYYWFARFRILWQLVLTLIEYSRSIESRKQFHFKLASIFFLSSTSFFFSPNIHYTHVFVNSLFSSHKKFSFQIFFFTFFFYL